MMRLSQFTSRFMAAVPGLLLAALIAGCAPVHDGRAAIAFRAPKDRLQRPLHLILASDSHDNLAMIDRFVAEANRIKPDLVIHTGDFQHYGTPNEWRQVDRHWKALDVAMAATTGNHDHRKQGFAHFQRVYGHLPRTVEVGGLHVVLIDDGAYALGAQLDFLERDLAAHEHQRTFVAMHVPLSIPSQLGWMQLLELLPSWKKNNDHPVDHLALPGPESRELLDCLLRHHVDALMCGHQHVYTIDRLEGGLPCIHAGTIGGYLPVLGEPHSFLTATVSDEGIRLERQELEAPPQGPWALYQSWQAYDRMAEKLEGP